MRNGEERTQVLIRESRRDRGATDPGGHIRLTAASAAGAVFLRVKDNGAGIDPDVLPHIFDLFRRGPGLDQRGSDGPDIGLAVVKALVELHGGHVTAYSAGTGTGSEFVVRLPARGRQHAAAPITESV